MRFLLKLSGEHVRLPMAELMAVLDGESIEYSVESDGRWVLLDAVTDEPAFINRLAYTLVACEVVGVANTLEGLAGDVFDSVEDVESFRVSASSDVAKRFGGLLHRLGWSVDLKKPGVDIFVVKFENSYVAATKMQSKREYERRRPQYRPYFHPTSMHPKLARCLVNLSRVSRGDLIADPFCGTGGILIEAGLMGMELGGLDIDWRMVEGCRQNLKEYGLEGDVRVGNAMSVSYKADAVVTDPPYGRASYVTDDAEDVYNGFLANARANIDTGSYVVYMLPSGIKARADSFEVRETYDVRVHKSLTRRIYVLQAV